MPGIDELLRDEGERWRTEVGARGPALARTAPRTRSDRLTRRRVLSWSASLAGAAAAAALLGVLTAHGGNGGRAASRVDTAGGASSAAAAGSAAAAPSCVGPFLTVVNPRASVSVTELRPPAVPDSPAVGSTVPAVKRGQMLVVQGVGYVATCIDTGPAVALPTPALLPAVAVRLSTADLRATTVGRARPRGADGSFLVRVRIPVDAAVGPAVLDDGRGHRLRLTIVAR